MGRLALIALLWVAISQQAFGWGDQGHRAVNKAAARRIPTDMPAFLKKAGARLQYLGPEPDRWRNKEEFAVKNAQEPDHYIDLERVADIPELPLGRYQFYKLLYDKRAAGKLPEGAQSPDDLLPEKVGLQPYITMEIYDRLKVSFREYRRMKAAKRDTRAVEQNIVFYMGWMGHYVADGANPLHTTVKYNGWIGPNPNGYTTEKGIHWRMEGQFVGDNLDKMPFASLVQNPEKLKKPWQDYLKYLRDSFTLVENVYQLDKAAGFTGQGTPESREFIRQRLARGAQMLVNLWYTAWLESAKGPERPKYD
ncbi:MAG: nuclease [Terriglobales bacterium]